MNNLRKIKTDFASNAKLLDLKKLENLHNKYSTDLELADIYQNRLFKEQSLPEIEKRKNNIYSAYIEITNSRMEHINRITNLNHFGLTQKSMLEKIAVWKLLEPTLEYKHNTLIEAMKYGDEFKKFVDAHLNINNYKLNGVDESEMARETRDILYKVYSK